MPYLSKVLQLTITMKRFTIVILALTACATLSAQQVYRTEFSVFDLREAALKNDHSRTEHHIRFAPKTIEAVGKVEVVGQTVEFPTAWSDYNVYIHIQNTIKAYDLVVNEQLVASVEDSYTPADFLLSPYLRQGKNEILLLLRRSECIELNSGSKSNLVEQFRGSYIFAQHRKHIYDYDARIVQSANGKSLALELDILVRNDFNYEEVVQVGYDIYSPDNKLIDYAVRDLPVAGRSIDTLQIRTSLGEESRYFISREDRAGTPTAYAAAKGLCEEGYVGSVFTYPYWIRASKFTTYRNGSFGGGGNGYQKEGVRPAMWVDIETLEELGVVFVP